MKQLLLLLLSAWLVSASSIVRDIDDCNTCLSRDKILCRSLWDETVSVCCDSEKEFNKGNCVAEPDDYFCSTQLNAISSFSCPFQTAYCGTQSSQVQMHPETRPVIRIEIENYLYTDESVCYY